MDKNVLKRFAIESRKHLHEKVADRYALYYLDEDFDEVEKDELYTLTNEKHNLVLTKEQYEHRQKLLKKKDRYGKEHVVEEAAFTWFNRFICLRYMEIHNFLPLGKNNESLDIRVLSSRDGNKEPEILKRNNLTNNSLDINVDIDKLEKIADINDKYEKVLLKVCEKMGKVLPQIFDGETDYIELLMPKNLLNVDSFIDKLIKEVPEDNFNDIEVIGWLYQYYNQSEKDRVMKEKRAYKKSEIPYVTQIFTPDWIVKYMVENSLGRLWIENTGDESLESEFKYFIKDNIEINVGANSMLPENITFIDPCMGSGHILVYAFEVFMKLYISAGYNKKDIPELILKNNLYGLDIDDRAGQFAIISVMLKAREYDSEIFNKIDFNSLNILSIPESSPDLRQYVNDIKDKEVRDIVDYLIDTFENGKEIGSLLIVEEKDYDNVTKYFEQATPNIFNRLLWEGLKDIIRVAKILSKKYDVVVTNPPYLAYASMGNILKEYVNMHYELGKVDLFSCFILFNNNVLKDKGYVSMVTMQSWMFLSSFESLRKHLIDNNNIKTLLYMNNNVMGIAFGTAAFTFAKKSYSLNESGVYYEIKYENIINNKPLNFPMMGNRNSFVNTSVFNYLPGKVIAYWLSEKMINVFVDNKKVSDYGEIKKGLSTGKNDLFIRCWYEVNLKSIGFELDKYEQEYRWIPLNKGGEYRKWYGNNEYIINWSNDGKKIKEFAGSVIRNPHYYFKKSLTWTMLSSGKFSIRASNKGFIFEGAGPSLFAYDKYYYYILSIISSKVGETIIDILNPTLNTNLSDIGNIPVIINEEYFSNVNNISKENISNSKKDWDSFETSWDFKKHPLV